MMTACNRSECTFEITMKHEKYCNGTLIIIMIEVVGLPFYETVTLELFLVITASYFFYSRNLTFACLKTCHSTSEKLHYHTNLNKMLEF